MSETEKKSDLGLKLVPVGTAAGPAKAGDKCYADDEPEERDPWATAAVLGLVIMFWAGVFHLVGLI